MADRTISVKIITDAKAYLAGMDEVARKNAATTKSVAEKLADQQAAYEKVGRASMAFGVATLAGIALAIKAATDWESAWAGVLKTVDGTPMQLDALQGSLRDLAKELPASHTEIAAVAEAAGQLGVQTNNVAAFTKTMIDLGETTNLSATEAATQLARFMNVMGTSQDKVSNLGAAIVELGNNYATTEAEIVAMAQRLSGAGNQIGLTEGEVVGLATALSSVGIEAEAGGSAISKVMIDIAASVDEGGGRVEQFARISGMSAEAFTQQWSTNPGAALAAFVQGLADAESQGESTLGMLSDLGITEVRMRDALLRAAAASGQFTAAMETGNLAFAENTALLDEAEKRYATVESQLQVMSNRINDAAINFGSVFLPAVSAATAGIGGFADLLAGMPPELQTIIGIVTALAGGIALFGGAALVAVPQIAAFRTASMTMGLSLAPVRAGLSSVLSVLGGPWGAALAVAGASVFTLSRHIDESRTSAAEYEQILRSGADAATLFDKAQAGIDISRFDLAATDLDKIPGWLDRLTGRTESFASEIGYYFSFASGEIANSGFIDALAGVDEQLSAIGASSPDGLEAALDGFTNLTEGMGLTAAEAAQLLDLMPSLRDQLLQAATAAGENVIGADGAADSQKLLAFAFRETEVAAVDAGYGLNEVTGEAVSMTEAITATAESVRAMNATFYAAQDAAAGFYEAADALTGALNDGLSPAINQSTGLFDLTTESGREAWKMFNNLGSSALDTAAAMLENGDSIDSVIGFMGTARQKAIDYAVGLGMTESQATALANELGLTTDQVQSLADSIANAPDLDIDATLDTGPAEQELNRFLGLASLKTVRLKSQVAPLSSGWQAMASGGMIPGTPSLTDNQFIYAASGEFVIRTQQAQKHRELLEAINSGAIDNAPAYARGGMVGTPQYQYSQPSSAVVQVGGGGGGGTNMTFNYSGDPAHVQHVFAEAEFEYRKITRGAHRAR